MTAMPSLLQRDIHAEGSRRIHGHSYRATITLAGAPDPTTGMLIDIGRLVPALPTLCRVTVSRDLSGDTCSFTAPEMSR